MYCSRVLHRIQLIADVPEDASVDIVPADGLCLIFDGVGIEAPYNISILNILEEYEKIKRKLTFEELKRI